MKASELKRIKDLEEEDAKLKKMYSNLAPEPDTAKHFLERSCKALPEKQLINELQTERPKDIS